MKEVKRTKDLGFVLDEDHTREEAEEYVRTGMRDA